MAKRKSRKSKAKPRQKTPRPGWWSRLDADQQRRAGRGLLSGLGLLVAIAALLFGLDRLEAHVTDQLLVRHLPQVAVVDIPPMLRGHADEAVREAVLPLFEQPWTQPTLCREMAEAVGEVPWVRQVRAARRGGNGLFQVRCDYRLPVAVVRHGPRDFFLVDREGVLLPGVYRSATDWLLIDGVAQGPPPPGELWPGEDLQAGLRMVEILRDQPFLPQVTGVLVQNFHGRQDPRGTHMALSTNQSGGRILWGSAPGEEIEENSVAEKLEILRLNYEGPTGRLDEGHTKIDISTRAGHYETVP